MRLGLSSASFYGRLETEDGAAHVRDFPVDACEVFLETYSEYTADFGRTVRQRLGELHCTSVHPKGTQFEPDLFGRSQRQAEDALRLFAGVCEAGAALGAPYYVFHGPGNARNPVPPDRINALEERFGRMQEAASRCGVRILWENVSWCSVRSVEHVQAARRLLPGIGFVLDVKQALRGGEDPLRLMEAMGEDLCHVHVLDWDGAAECLPGEGVTDWPLFFRRLRSIGYDGAVILEPYERQARDEEALRRSLLYLRSLM